MAVCRPQEHCHICGEPLKARHRNMGKHFIGDTFIGWDYEGHKCKKNKRYREYMRRREEFRNDPKVKAATAAFFEEALAKQKRIQHAREEAVEIQSELVKFGVFLRRMADQNQSEFPKKFSAIKKFAEELFEGLM